MADFLPCVKEILCGLSSPILRELQVLIDGQVALLKTQIGIYQTQLLQYDVLGAPIQTANQIAQGAISKVKESASLVPLSVISQSECTDLGIFNINVNQTIDLASSYVDEISFELTRLVSFKEELNLLIGELNAAIDQLTNIQDVIDQCLAGQ